MARAREQARHVAESAGHRAEPDPLKRIWTDGHDLRAWFSTVQNVPIVYRFMTTVFGYFLVGGLMALLMRTQLIRPENTFLDPATYNGILTVHGSTMIFLFATPMMEAFAEFLLPTMVGARELPFPRMTAFMYWILLFGGLLFFGSFLLGALPDVGWFAYTPLSNIHFSPGLGVDFWLLGLDVAQIAAIGDGFEFIVGILKTRAPGMSLDRLPLYLWSILLMGFMLLFGFTPLFIATLLLQLDRHFGTRFFDPAMGGDPLLWQHLFWIFGHPDVYIMFLPATGMVSMILPTFTRRPMVCHTLMVLAMLATAFISFGVWVHHMFAVGLPLLALSFFTAASFVIAIPAGIQVFAWLATLLSGRPILKPPLLFVLGFIVTFVIGGLSGVMVAVVPFDWQVTDTYFLVAHFHYVLIGGVVFPIFAGLYYWLPKLSGRMLHERLGVLNFWLMFVGFNLAFFPMHITGLLGMPRRIYTYPPDIGWEWPNLLSTIGAYVLGISILVFIANVVYSIYLGQGDHSGDNPWAAGSLEWASATPPPDEGYRVIPIVRSRYPLWDQERLDQGDQRTVRLVHDLEHSPTHWRATLLTTVVDAVPEGILRVAEPSLWPLFTALAITVVFGAELFSQHLLAVAGALGAIVAIIAWLWPPPVERNFELAGETTMLHGLPVYHAGPRAPGWWAMLLVLLTLAVGSGTLIFSYYYLRGSAASWPPPGIQRPDLLLPVISILVLVASAIPLLWAERSIRRGSQEGLLAGMAVSFLLGVGFLGIQVVQYSQLGFGPGTSAYGSIFYTLAGLQSVIVLLGLLMSGVVQVQAWLGYFNRWRFLAVQNTALYWYFTAAHWIVVAAVLYLSPYVL